jgi:hypothetical protein
VPSIEFVKNDQPLALPKTTEVEQAVSCIQAWAKHNEFQKIKLRLEDEPKLFVQFDEASTLSSWIDLSAVTRGDTEALEEQLDFARGEFRRRAAGYSQFDR